MPPGAARRKGSEGGAKPGLGGGNVGQVAKVSDEPEFQTPQGPAGAELTATAALIAGRCGPLRVGDIEIDGRGRIRARGDKGPLRFAFTYRGVEFGAEVATGAEPRVRLSAELGKLPYSMEIGHGRHTIRRILMASAQLPHGRIGLSDSDDMRIEAESSPPSPFTPASLMAAVAALLLDFRPYLDLVARVLDGARRTDATPG